MLDPWAMAHSRRRKAVIWRLWERRALEDASCLQALCPAEMRAIRSLGLSAPVALIPNGVALPDQDAPLPPAPWVDRVPSGDRVLLFLGRFHAKKGLDPLLEAWRHMSREAVSSGWWLALVGYGDRGRLERRLELDPIPRGLLLDPCFGERKLAALATASAFVLPSFSEGLPVAALEAMSWGLPCLLSAACNLPEAFTAGAALQAEPEPRALEEALRRLFQLGDADLAVMGGAGRRLVADQFTWPRIAAQCAELYRWILGGGSPPSCVNGAT
ncbi:D-inositol-3-phosphate glycosyltransferase [Synechococcus sp. CBW1107]|nr:D-inositol-3-phosphate glycosyltransferase [Synechococcus sp. CBW1107]